MEFSFCNKHETDVKPEVHQNSAALKACLGKFQNHWSQISILNPENHCIPRRHRLLGKTT